MEATEVTDLAIEIARGDQSETPYEDPLTRIPKLWKTERDGKPYVLFAGLTWLLHEVAQELSGDGVAHFEIATDPQQLPTEENKRECIVLATVKILDQHGKVLRQSTQIGDASPTNVNRMMAASLIRMAETRAIGRCLRLLLNIGVAALEELPDKDTDTRQDARTGDGGGKQGTTTTQAPKAPQQGAQAPTGQAKVVETWTDKQNKVWDRPALSRRHGELVGMARRNGFKDRITINVQSSPLADIAASCGKLAAWAQANAAKQP
jgi:hypothetical protein